MKIITNTADFLVGLEVSADHPITPLNPSKTFKIKEIKIDLGIEKGFLYVRGEETMWFSSSMIKRVN